MKTRHVLLLAVVLFGWNVWAYDLWAPNEPFFGEGAREMVRDGEWIVPHVNGVVNTHKPPLFFWLIALFSWPFDAVTSLTARLPSILAALGTVWLTARLGRRVSDPPTAALAALMLVTTHMFWDQARWAQIDSLLCFLILVALSAFESFRAGDADGRRAGLLFWAAAALAVLAKGPVGVLLPLGVALLTLGLDRDLGKWRRFAPFLGPVVFVAVLAPWVAAATLWGGEYSVWGALREHFVDRAVHGMHHVQPFWYYAKVLPYALLPWSFLLAGALALAWRRRREPADRFLLAWVAFVVLFFTISTEKRDLYILPAMPAFALLSARLVAAVPPAGSKWIFGSKWITVPQGFVGGLMIVAGVAAPWVAGRQGAELVAPAWGITTVFVLGGLAILVAALTGRARRAVRWSAGTMATAMLVAVTFVYPALDSRKSGRELARVVREKTATARAAGLPLLGLGLENVPQAVNFYSDGVYLQRLAEESVELTEHLRGEAYLLANEALLEEFPRHVRKRLRPVHATRFARKDLVLFHVVEPDGSSP